MPVTTHRLLCIAAFLVASDCADGRATFTPLGVFATYNGSNPLNISSDGTTVVGDGPGRWFRWSAGTGFQQLAAPVGNFGQRGATAESGLFYGFMSVSGAPLRAYFGNELGTTVLTSPEPRYERSEATGATPDGSVVVGTLMDMDAVLPDVGLASRPFRWTLGGGMQILGTLGPAEYGSSASAVTPDGAVIAGSYTISTTEARGFRWTQAGGMVGLGALPLTTSTLPQAISADGSAIVGYGRIASGTKIFRWTVASGMLDLGTLSPGSNTFPQAVNPDGTVVVGSSNNRAFVWTPNAGIQDLNVLLPSLGVDLTGWTLRTARSVSADGSVVTGWGIHAYAPGQQRNEAYVAALPRPCPPDLNNDRSINVVDLTAFLARFGQSVPSRTQGDFTGDGQVTTADLVEFLAMFGTACG